MPLAIDLIPADQFEEAVESDDPPSAKKLAAMGRRKRPTRPLVDLGERTLFRNGSDHSGARRAVESENFASSLMRDLWTGLPLFS